MKYGETLISSIAVIIIAICTFIAIEQRDTLKQEAITRGYAEYNSTNGNWQWKTLTTTNSVVK